MIDSPSQCLGRRSVWVLLTNDLAKAKAQHHCHEKVVEFGNKEEINVGQRWNIRWEADHDVDSRIVDIFLV